MTRPLFVSTLVVANWFLFSVAKGGNIPWRFEDCGPNTTQQVKELKFGPCNTFDRCHVDVREPIYFYLDFISGLSANFVQTIIYRKKCDDCKREVVQRNKNGCFQSIKCPVNGNKQTLATFSMNGGKFGEMKGKMQFVVESTTGDVLACAEIDLLNASKTLIQKWWRWARGFDIKVP